ncbi:SEFIR domain-containing protein [Rufibacter sp. XAAS-G3-1]|uniref:SEFIR domain-containing protein n=1 Tax=Rufibacter sp. XAAS-G3-1 TaxID=2729134 RepID=UPI00351A6426
MLRLVVYHEVYMRHLGLMEINKLETKVFISYSHDSNNHKDWVLQLATRLRLNGVDVILDQ